MRKVLIYVVVTLCGPAWAQSDAPFIIADGSALILSAPEGGKVLTQSHSPASGKATTEPSEVVTAETLPELLEGLGYFKLRDQVEAQAAVVEAQASTIVELRTDLGEQAAAAAALERTRLARIQALEAKLKTLQTSWATVGPVVEKTSACVASLTAVASLGAAAAATCPAAPADAVACPELEVAGAAVSGHGNHPGALRLVACGAGKRLVGSGVHVCGRDGKWSAPASRCVAATAAPTPKPTSKPTPKPVSKPTPAPTDAKGYVLIKKDVWCNGAVQIGDYYKDHPHDTLPQCEALCDENPKCKFILFGLDSRSDHNRCRLMISCDSSRSYGYGGNIHLYRKP